MSCYALSISQKMESDSWHRSGGRTTTEVPKEKSRYFAEWVLFALSNGGPSQPADVEEHTHN